MTEITIGMTPTEFITAMNSNFTDTVAEHTTLVDSMLGDELQTTLNSNFNKSDIYLGQKGYISKLNANFAEHDVSLTAPNTLAVEWIDDFARITFNESSGNQCEIWEQLNSEDYVLAHTLDSGVETYDYYTWQGADLNFRIRAKNGSLYSPFSDVVNISTPIVIKTDQTTLSQVLIHYFGVTTGGTVNVDWGDSTSHDFTVGTVTDYTHDYDTEGIYFISISGDLDKWTEIDWVEQSHLFGDLTKWVYPSALWYFHFYTNPKVTGDITDWVMAANQEVFHIGGDDFYGDITNWDYPDTIRDFRIQDNRLTGDLTNWVFPENDQDTFYFTCDNNLLTGDLTNWVFPSNMVLLGVTKNYFTGDVSGWDIPNTFVRILLADDYVDDDETNVFTGDLSDWDFPTIISTSIGTMIHMAHLSVSGDWSTKNILPDDGFADFDLVGCNFTGMPRGDFKWVSLFGFRGNNCSTSEIDSLLAYIDSFFVDEVAPLISCTYLLDGTGMGIPTAAGLASKASIEGKYAAAGKSITIYVNS